MGIFEGIDRYRESIKDMLRRESVSPVEMGKLALDILDKYYACALLLRK